MGLWVAGDTVPTHAFTDKRIIPQPSAASGFSGDFIGPQQSRATRCEQRGLAVKVQLAPVLLEMRAVEIMDVIYKWIQVERCG